MRAFASCPPAGASRSRSRSPTCDAVHTGSRERRMVSDGGINSDLEMTQAGNAWEVFGTNRGGMGRPQGRPPRHLGTDACGSWKHDLFEQAPVAEVGLPPRGQGSGRSLASLQDDGCRMVAVQNFDGAVACEQDLWSLFSKVGPVLDVWIRWGRRACGFIEFETSADALQAVRRYHRHPWKGGRPINVRLNSRQ
eukprot:TRINITY_DN14806_c0_g1_i1.p1 TRINITY_DN14806_c0_g1~~TRINITY_DN14806_c0_g1_i1.p1  ORF type:complete len:194 (+),score=25.90 TRINITY_DN14806_c0_g1_i1:54-635(+)